MTTKLTLTVEEDIIRKAKSYAKETGRSLSELVENYLENLVEQTDHKDQISPKLKSLIGVVKLPDNFDEKKELQDYYANKHL